ncbi:hypothetical protein J4464_00720 [Candidatus Woesearchaeota archaeon]|nr:hypothetical protein [Candidatus Woesearchaeota archaeon]
MDRKRYGVFFAILLALALFAWIVYAQVSDISGFYNVAVVDAVTINVSTFNRSGIYLNNTINISTYGGNMNISGDVRVGGGITLGGVQRTTWASYDDAGVTGNTTILLHNLTQVNQTVEVLKLNASNLNARMISLNSSMLTNNVTGGLTVDTSTLYVDSGRDLVGILSTNPSNASLFVNGNVSIASNLSVDQNTLFVDSANDRVGVSTGVPSVKLDVASGDVKFGSGFTYNGTSSSVNVTGGFTVDSGTLYVNAGDNEVNVTGTLGVSGAINAYNISNINARVISLNSSMITNNITGGISVDSGTMYVDSGNNFVGVGTTQPGLSLKVNSGDVAFGSGFVYNGTSSSANISGGLTVDSGTFYVNAGTNKVGVGTTAPDTDFAVVGTGHALKSTAGTSGTFAGLFYSKGTQQAVLMGMDAYPLDVRANGVQGTLVVNSIGMTGLGVVSPNSRLHIVGVDANATVVNAPSALKIIGGTGYFTGGGGVGGSGGNFTFEGGSGGTGSVGAPADVGGKGSGFYVKAGLGGTVSDPGEEFQFVAGAGGDINLTAGTGGDASLGASSTGGKGGDVTFQAGTGGAGDSADGAAGRVNLNPKGTGEIYAGSSVNISNGLTVDTSTLYVDAGRNNVAVGSSFAENRFKVMHTTESTDVGYVMVNITREAGVDAQIGSTTMQKIDFRGDGAVGVSGAYTFTGLNISNKYVSSDNLGEGTNIALHADVSGGDENIAGMFTGGSVVINVDAGNATLDPNASLFVMGNASISSNLTVDQGTLFVDSSLDRIGIGTTTPAAGVEVDVATGKDVAIESGGLCIGTGGCTVPSPGYVSVDRDVVIGASNEYGAGNLEVEEGTICVGTGGCTPPTTDGRVLFEGAMSADGATTQAYNAFGTIANVNWVEGAGDVFIADELEVNGAAHFDGGYSDIAESLQTEASRENDFCNGDVACLRNATNDNIDYGDLVCISGPRTIKKCEYANAKEAVGIVSNTTRIRMGETNGYPIALAGVVYAKVTNENGEIHPGDLLVSASAPGFAMKSEAPQDGTVVGKAFDFCDAEQCNILIFIALS